MNLSQYEIVGIVIVGIGVIYSAMKPFFNVNTNMTELRNDMRWVIESIKDLKIIFVDYDSKNEKEHNIIFDKLREHHDRLNSIETKHEILKGK